MCMAIGNWKYCKRRVIGNTVCMVTRTDVEEVVCIDQLCAGTKLGIEGAIHAVKDIFCENKASVGVFCWLMPRLDCSSTLECEDFMAAFQYLPWLGSFGCCA